MKSIFRSVINSLGVSSRFDLFMAKSRAGDALNIKNAKTLHDFFDRLIKPGMLCFDIGANIGSYSEAFLNLGAKVVAAEPQPYCYQYLESRFKNNPNFILEKTALDDKEGITEMFLNNSHTISSLSSEWIDKVTQNNRFGNSDWSKSIPVKVTTLDQLIKKYGKPYFCKIDVEGYELNVCRGLTSTIPYLSFEFSPEMLENTNKVIDHLCTLGKVKFFWHDATINFYSPDGWYTGNEFKNQLVKRAEEGVSADFYVWFDH